MEEKEKKEIKKKNKKNKKKKRRKRKKKKRKRNGEGIFAKRKWFQQEDTKGYERRKERARMGPMSPNTSLLEHVIDKVIGAEASGGPQTDDK